MSEVFTSATVPTDPASAASRPRAFHHKSECECKICQGIRRNLGIPNTIAETRTGSASYKKRKFASELVKNGGNATKAAIAAGYKATNAPNLVKDPSVNSFVRTSLARAGITDDFLAQLAKEGMSAFNQRIITDRDGAIVDVVNMPDWRNRHAFWRDVLMAKKILGGENEQSTSGGLVIIAPDSARVVSAHSATCLCDECVAAWQARTNELRRLAANETAIEIAPTQIAERAAAGATTISSGQDSEDYQDRE